MAAKRKKTPVKAISAARPKKEAKKKPLSKAKPREIEAHAEETKKKPNQLARGEPGKLESKASQRTRQGRDKIGTEMLAAAKISGSHDAVVLGFPVVGIGASAGGVEALEKLFEHMPADTGMAFVVVQHLSPSFESQMASILGSKTKMKVVQIEHEMPIEPNTVYVILPNRYLTIIGGKFHLSAPAPKRHISLPIDIFYHSLAEELGERAIAVILSGSGSNGSLGVRTVEAAGGLVIAQDPESAVHSSMPRSAIDTGLVDYVLKPEEIPEVIVQYSKRLRQGLRVTALPLEGGAQGEDKLALIVFDEEAAEHAPIQVEGEENDSLVRQLEFELKGTKSELQSTIEQLEISNEEFKAANEEMMSMNEELQSANEELETSKEELQSLNEELSTVNHELQNKVAELETANDDLSNLLSSTELATLFLDSDFRIKRFTPAATQLFNLIPSDLGRPIGNFTHRVEDPSLLDDAARVVDTLQPNVKQVCSTEGRWYIRRILPYRTESNKISGVVITFSDVTELKQAETIAQKGREFTSGIIESVVDPIVVIDSSRRILTANAAYYRCFHTSRKETEGEDLFEVVNGQWKLDAVEQRLESLKQGKTDEPPVEITFDTARHTKRVMELDATLLTGQEGGGQVFILMLHDVTALSAEQARLAEVAAELERRMLELERANRELEHITYVLSHDLQTPLRGIRNYVDFVVADLEGKLDPKAAENLRNLSKSADNFVKLFEDLLQYLMLGRGPVRSANLDLASMINNISAYYSGDKNKKIGVKGPMPRIHAPQGLVHQIFQNLIANGLVHNTSKNPRVEISAEPVSESPKVWRFTFKDNGVGISPEDQERIFGVFERLTPEKSGAGSGIGLAIVRKVTERLGGKIRVQSKPGQGSTFQVDLPEKPELS